MADVPVASSDHFWFKAAPDEFRICYVLIGMYILVLMTNKMKTNGMS